MRALVPAWSSTYEHVAGPEVHPATYGTTCTSTAVRSS
jgi:hypothetical protein